MYDSRMARWMSTDPMKQYWSPYKAMGNNPVNLADPTGGKAPDLILRGSDGKEWRIPAPGDDKYIDIPFPLFENKGDFLSLGISLPNLENVAVGMQLQIGGTGATGPGFSSSVVGSSVYFLGGDYKDYWYPFGGAESVGVTEFGLSASIDITGSIFIAQSKKGNLNPISFAGDYLTIGGSIGAKLGAGIDISVQHSWSTDWNVYEIGFGGGIGLPQNNVSVGNIFVGGGSTGILTKVIPTNKRNWADRTLNKLTYGILPTSWINGKR